MATGDRVDPYGVYSFLVEIDGITRAGFRQASGLDATQDPTEYREGHEPLTVRKLPGLNVYSNISLQWGVSDDTELIDWRRKAASGQIERKNGSIVLLNDAGEERVRWNFREGWPCKWAGPDLDATSNDVAIDNLEIAHEGVERA